jgi:MurNAc alpha-1-phosphate uridylyltransferase
MVKHGSAAYLSAKIMKAMILAAGRGERMGLLTDNVPKPLLKVKGKPLIQYTIENLVHAGFEEIVINVAYLATQIMDTLGNGHQWGANIVYSNEGDQALETAGGIIKALPLLGEQPFIVTNSDIACDFPLASLRQRSLKLAHLVLVDNPDFHSQGDFALADNGILSNTGTYCYTFSGIGLYHPKLFMHYDLAKLKLRYILKSAANTGEMSGEKFTGFWMDIGTPQRLQALNDKYSLAFC